MASNIADEQKEEMARLYSEGLSTVEIGKRYEVSASLAAHIIKKQIGSLRSNKVNSRRYVCNMDFFETIDSEDKAYWLGFIYADGYVASVGSSKRVGIALASKDTKHLEKFKEVLETDYPIHQYQSSGGYSDQTRYCRIEIYGDKMHNDLSKHGAIKNKSLVLKPPMLREDLVRHFIRGYFDGDGCITSYKTNEEHKARFSIKILGTKEMLDYIKSFIESHTEIRIRQYSQRRESCSVLTLEFGGSQQVKTFLDILYQESAVYLERKYCKYQTLCNQYNSRP